MTCIETMDSYMLEADFRDTVELPEVPAQFVRNRHSPPSRLSGNVDSGYRRRSRQAYRQYDCLPGAGNAPVIDGFNDTASGSKQYCIHELFEARQPSADNTALITPAANPMATWRNAAVVWRFICKPKGWGRIGWSRCAWNGRRT
jgi:hypothetical protein